MISAWNLLKSFNLVVLHVSTMLNYGKILVSHKLELASLFRVRNPTLLAGHPPSVLQCSNPTPVWHFIKESSNMMEREQPWYTWRLSSFQFLRPGRPTTGADCKVTNSPPLLIIMAHKSWCGGVWLPGLRRIMIFWAARPRKLRQTISYIGLSVRISIIRLRHSNQTQRVFRVLRHKNYWGCPENYWSDKIRSLCF